jgi:predicted ATP-grasp superfamily ATP-dependent carboligase
LEQWLLNTKKNILLTGGRAPVTLHLARLFAKAGHTVFIAESIKQHICLYSNAVKKNFIVPSPRFNRDEYIQALTDIIEQEKIDLLIPTCEEVFYISEKLNELSKYCSVFAEKSDKLLSLHNKWQFINSINDSQIKTPKTWLVNSLEKLKQQLTLINDIKKFVLKPVYSRFGSKTIIISSFKGNIPNINISQKNPWILQEFIEGSQFCTYSIAKNGKISAHTAYPTTFTAGIGSSIAFENIDYPKVFDWISEYVKKNNYTGQIAFDFIETPDKEVYVIECNPRATSGIHLFDEINLIGAFLENSEEIISPNKSTKAVISLAILTYGLSCINSFDKLKSWIKTIFSSKDTVFSLSDPLPFVHQFFILAGLGLVALKNKIKITEVSTMDIEWNGES